MVDDACRIEETDFDNPLGVGTGVGVIFGVTGGVMEAALRSAYYLVNKKNPDLMLSKMFVDLTDIKKRHLILTMV